MSVRLEVPVNTTLSFEKDLISGFNCRSLCFYLFTLVLSLFALLTLFAL